MHFSCNKYSWCFWCQWCSMYRYIQTLTLKRHPGGRDPGRLPGVLVMVTPPSWSAFFGGFLHFADFFRFLPGEMPFFSFQGIPYKKKVASGIAPLKRIQNVPARPLFPISQENKPSILPSTAFSVPGWYKYTL